MQNLQQAMKIMTLFKAVIVRHSIQEVCTFYLLTIGKLINISRIICFTL